jgi:hypothetical protein
MDGRFRAWFMSVQFWRPLLLIVVIFLALGLMLPVGAGQPGSAGNPGGNPTPVSTPTPGPAVQKSWVKLPPMPETASQADYGAELFRLVCRDCHGDKGQGLTQAWRATWAPEDQNCWQSKCHAPNHPPDGFEVPHYIRPIIGPGTLLAFETAADLFKYVRDDSPWYNPGSMTDEENWQLTAFLLRENGIDLKGEPLEPGRAASLLLHPEGWPEMTTAMPEMTTAMPEMTTAMPEMTTAMPETTTTAPEAPAVIWPWLALLLIPIAAILLLGLRQLRQ